MHCLLSSLRCCMNVNLQRGYINLMTRYDMMGRAYERYLLQYFAPDKRHTLRKCCIIMYHSQSSFFERKRKKKENHVLFSSNVCIWEFALLQTAKVDLKVNSGKPIKCKLKRNCSSERHYRLQNFEFQPKRKVNLEV